MEYHRLVHLHKKYCEEVACIASHPKLVALSGLLNQGGRHGLDKNVVWVVLQKARHRTIGR